MEFAKAIDESDLPQSIDSTVENVNSVMIDVSKPLNIIYCGVCSMPPEFCEYGACFDQCLPWIRDNCPEVLSEEVLARAMGSVSLEEGKAEGEVGVLHKAIQTKLTCIVIYYSNL
jgi:density-regulated protein